MPAAPASPSASVRTATRNSSASSRCTSPIRRPTSRSGWPAMAEPVPLPRGEVAPPQRLCAAGDLLEKGKAIVFDVLHYREPARAFAMRFDGKVVCYLNRCVHVPTELDWQPGEFLDSGKEFILCSIHGAAYEPRDGR